VEFGQFLELAVETLWRGFGQFVNDFLDDSLYENLDCLYTNLNFLCENLRFL